MKSFEEILSLVRKNVEEDVEDILRKYSEEANNISIELNDLLYISRDFMLRGGKRFRAFLILIGYWSREWGLEIERIKPLMTAIEFLQSYLLVHDDIMDRDTVRRGGPTIHIWFDKKCRSEDLLGDCTHYGVSQAIIVGDYLETLAVNSIARLNLPINTFVKILETYTRGLRLVSYGQYLDVLLSMKPIEKISEEHVLLVHKLKTASYTVELPLHLGAIASNRYSNELLEELSKYALPAGIAFQMRDDILGLYGDPSVTGKPVGSDVREKKKTLLIVKAYQEASPVDQIFLEEIYNKKKPEDISEDDVLRVQEIVKSTGAYDYVVSIMEKKAGEARNALKNAVLINNEARSILGELLEIFIKREK